MGRIGDACLDFYNAMEAEHCHSGESTTSFKTRNYGLETCPANEWRIAVHNDTSGADTRYGRKFPKISELLQLPVVRDAELSRPEVIAVVLYTGPMYEKYNCILRRWPQGAYKEMVQKGATYTTTIHALVSAVQKLASVMKLPDGLKLYRGLGGVIDLPKSFFKSHANGWRGFTEWGFMSTTSDKHVAVYYSSMGHSKVTPPLTGEHASRSFHNILMRLSTCGCPAAL